MIEDKTVVVVVVSYRSGQNCDLLAVAVASHFDHHLVGLLLAAIGRADDCCCRFQLWFVICILETNFCLIQKVSRTLFVHSLHLQALVNINIAF